MGGKGEAMAVRSDEAWSTKHTEYRNNHYRQTWSTGMLTAPCSKTCCCLTAFILPCCVSYHARRRTIYNDMSRYICCGGYCPCSGKCGEKSCPQLCLCLETVFCFAQSVMSTRFMIQDEMQLENTSCDNCLMGTVVVLQQIACILQIVACFVGSGELQDAANIVSCIADLVYCSVCACMQAQHEHQLDQRDLTPTIALGVPAPPMIVPPGQAPPMKGHPGKTGAAGTK